MVEDKYGDSGFARMTGETGNGEIPVVPSAVFRIATRVANAPGRPEWYPESSFAHQ